VNVLAPSWGVAQEQPAHFTALEGDHARCPPPALPPRTHPAQAGWFVSELLANQSMVILARTLSLPC